MARISGTVSRTIPLDPVIGRPLSLSGTFDLFVTGAELARITPVLDALIASGILTAHQRSTESDGLIASVSAPVVDVPNASGVAAPSPLQVIPFAVPDAAATYTYTALRRMEVVDLIVHKVGAGTGTTYQVQDAAGAAITDAVAATTSNQRAAMGTIDRTKNQVAAGAQFRVAVAKSSGSAQAAMYLYVILR